GEALGAERAGELGEDRERVLALPAVGQDAGERQPRVDAARVELERAAQVLLAARLDERVGLGGEQLVEEARDDRRRLRAGELGRDGAVLERLDGGDALDPERGGEALVGV